MKFMLLTIALTVTTVAAQNAVTNIVPADASEAAFSTNAPATNISETIPTPVETSTMGSDPEDISVPDIHQPEDIRPADIHAEDIHRADDLHAPDIHAAEPGE